MSIRCSVDGLRDCIEDVLEKYQTEVTDGTCEAVERVSKEAVQRLKAKARAVFGSGPYAKGWTRKLNKERLSSNAVVYGKAPTYRLAHLLENGHVIRNGTKRVFGRTRAFEHIAPVEEWAVEELEEEIVHRVERLNGSG